VGVQSNAIILLVILDVYTAYVADLGRILLQSLRRTAPLGLYTLVWMLLRFLFCMVGLLIFRTVWGGFIGIVTSAVLVFSALHLWVAKQTRDLQIDVSPVPSLLTMSPMAIGYGLTITISNLDVLVSYFMLNGEDLGVYSASSVFPKAIIVVVMPLLQMLFPIAMGAQVSKRQYHAIIGKSVAVLLAVTVCGSIATWALSDLLCGGTWGIKNCETGTLNVLLWSVVPMAFLRALVLLQFVLKLDYLAIWLSIPALIYTWIAFTSEHTIAVIARQFSLFAATVFIFLSAVHLVTRIRGSRVHSTLGKP
jgi:O-antigen/teichoic acid export membrane protein